MVKHRVGAFLQGHDHVFATKQVDGVQYTVCGTPSAPWLFHKEGRYQRGPIQYGHVRVSALPTDGPRAGKEILRVEYVGADGSLHHAYDLLAIEGAEAREEL